MVFYRNHYKYRIHHKRVYVYELDSVHVVETLDVKLSQSLLQRARLSSESWSQGVITNDM